MSDPSGITLTQAVAILGRSERTIRRLIQSGQIRAEKVIVSTGQRWLLNSEDVARLVEEVPTPADPTADLNGNQSNTEERPIQVEEVPTPADPTADPGADLPLTVARIEGAMVQQWVGLVADLRTELQELKEATRERDAEAQRREETLLELMQSNHEAEERRATEQTAQLEALREELAELKKPWWKWWWRK